jgi:hypothetical protein
MKWKSALTLTAVFLILSTTGQAENDPDDHYVIELQVLVASDQQLVMQSRSVTTEEDLTSVGGVYEMTVGDITVDLEADLMWNGKAEPPKDSGIELLAAPRISVKANQSASMRSASTVQYFEQQDDDCFVLRALPPDASPGIFLDVKPEAGPTDQKGAETVDLDLTLRISTLGERAALPGVSLDVGRPTLHSRETSSAYRYRLDRWNVISSHITQEPKKETLVLLIRVTRE